MSKNSMDDEEQINVQSLGQGLYILQVKLGEKIVTKRIVVN